VKRKGNKGKGFRISGGGIFCLKNTWGPYRNFQGKEIKKGEGRDGSNSARKEV